MIVTIIFIILFLPTIHATTYVYDNLNRLTQVTYPNGATVNYSYDSAGNTLEVRTAMTEANLSVSPKALDFADVQVGQVVA